MGKKPVMVPWHGQRIPAENYADLQRLYQIAYGRTDVRLNDAKAETTAAEAALAAFSTLHQVIAFHEKKEGISHG